MKEIIRPGSFKCEMCLTGHDCYPHRHLWLRHPTTNLEKLVLNPRIQWENVFC